MDSTEAEVDSTEAEVDSTVGSADFTEGASVASAPRSGVHPPRLRWWLPTLPSAVLPSGLRWWVPIPPSVARFAPELIVSITDSSPVAFTTDDFSAHPSLPVPIRMMTATITVTPTPSISGYCYLTHRWVWNGHRRVHRLVRLCQ